MKRPQELLKEIGLSQAESELYLAMLSHGALLPTELMRLTGGKRPTVYYALRQLVARGLAHRVPAHGVQRFQADPPERLLALLELRVGEVRALAKDVEACLPELKQQAVPQDGLPAVSFYQGEEAMKQIILETLYARRREIDILAPAENFFWQVGQAFSADYIAERTRRGIKTRHLWEEGPKPQVPAQFAAGLAEARLLPAVMRGKYRSMVLLYDDKVMTVSSLKSGYVLLVQSKEHRELMGAVFDGLWEGSKPF